MSERSRRIYIEYTDKTNIRHKVTEYCTLEEQSKVQSEIYQAHGFNCELVTTGETK